MTQNADFKRRVRARMARTGESYTAARAQLVERDQISMETLAGTKDSTLLEKTGRTWQGWSDALDALGARTLDHTAIARLVREHWPEVGAWWAQTLTVGYERVHGLREAGQMPGGTFTANKSRTVPLPVETLYERFLAGPWLEGADVTTARAPASIRAVLPDGTRLVAGFTAKGPQKSTVTVQHAQLDSAAARDASKARWTELLASL